MDFPDMVRTRAIIVEALRKPALHFLILGTFLYGGEAYYKTRVYPSPGSPKQVVIPHYEIEKARQEFFAVNNRLPDAREQAAMNSALVDNEVLYQYALYLGLNSQPVVQRRLAQIAAFVEENPDEAKSMETLASQAQRIGLQEGDLVVRRMMIDGARRLIRAGILARLPDDELLQAYLKENPGQFQRPGKTRLIQLTFNAFVHGKDAEAKANEVLSKIRKNALSPEQAVRLGDDFWIDSSIPLATDQELMRDFDQGFVMAIKAIPLNLWSGPVKSRYGQHLVLIQERTSSYVPALDEIRKEVKQRLLQKLADEWLALRLQQLKQEFQVRVQ